MAGRFSRRRFVASASLGALAATTAWPWGRWTAVAATPGILGPRPVDLTPQGTIRDAATLTEIRNQITASRPGDTVRIAAGSYGRLTTSRDIGATGTVRIIPASGATVTLAGLDMTGAQGLDFRAINTTGTADDDVWMRSSRRCSVRGGRHGIRDNIAFNVRDNATDCVIEDVTVDGAYIGFNFNAASDAAAPLRCTLRRFRSLNSTRDHVIISRARFLVVEDFEAYGHTESGEHNDFVQAVGPKDLIVRRGHMWNPRSLRENAIDRNDHGFLVNYTRESNQRIGERIRLENLLIHDMTSYGIVLAGARGVDVVNCTSVDHGKGGATSGFQADAEGSNQLTSLKAINNVFSEWYSTGVSYLTNTNNLVVDGSGPAGTAKLTGSAGFKQAADQDYRLAAGSRCLRSGTSSGAPAVDLFGASRSGGVDRGAIQGAF